MKFRWKLFFSYFLVVLIPFLVAERYISSHLRDRLLQQVEDRLSKHAFLLKGIIEKEYADRKPSFELDTLIKSMAKDLDERITFINYQGAVLADTKIASEDLSSIEDHSRRPEFIEAFKGSRGMAIRYSTTLKMDMMYLAVKVAPKREFLGVIRVSVPLTQVKSLIRSTEYSLATAFVLCVFLIIILNIFVSRKLSQPVEEVTRAAEEISRGNFDVKASLSAKGELGALGDSINLMASEIKKSIREITHEKETLNTILRGMSDGVMVVDVQGKIILINSVLEDLLQRPSDVDGKTPVEIIRNAELQDAFSQVLNTGETFTMELSLATPQADKIFDVTIARLMDQDTAGGAVAVFHDITELKRVEQMRKDLVANVSHELRTPLTSIKGYAETLCDDGIENVPQAESFAQIILKHANRLSTLVQDLLSLTHLESQGTPILKAEMDLRKVLDAAVLVVKPSADSKQLNIAIESVPEETILWADRDQIGQALINILDNAVKYTPEGGSITVSMAEEENEVHVTVADTGIGIPREHLNRIFERFYRVDKNRSRELGGTGLGLSIVKHIIHSHGGRVWVQSELESGSAFTFSLPKRPNDNSYKD
jgi:two-component system phosphate regulon sensor histidine kinase PhoR